jgi:biopolymer transport protein ExbD
MKLNVGKRVHYDSGPNMTPLVDVVMVILIFLMLAGSFAGTEWYLVSNLPYRGDKSSGEAPENAVVPENEPLEIRVDQNPTNDGFVARAGKIQSDNITTLSVALTKMRRDLEAAGQKKEDVQVVISPGRNVTLQHVVDVFQAAQLAEFSKIGFSRAR